MPTITCRIQRPIMAVSLASPKSRTDGFGHASRLASAAAILALNRGALHIAVGAEDATTARLRLYAIAAGLAVVEVQARIGRHGLAGPVSALGACNRR